MDKKTKHSLGENRWNILVIRRLSRFQKVRACKDRIQTHRIFDRGLEPSATPEENKDMQSAPVQSTGSPISQPATSENILAKPSYEVLAKGSCSEKQLLQFALSLNSKLSQDYVSQVVACYIKECAAEDINHDVAFAHMLHITCDLQFNRPFEKPYRHGENNFGGICREDSGKQEADFDDIATGVRAHVQHLLGYSSHREPSSDIVDPRFKLLKKAMSENKWELIRTVEELEQRWSLEKDYGKSINAKLAALWAFKA